MTSCPKSCPICKIELKAISLNSLRCHLNRVHGLNAEQAYLTFNDHPEPCIQCQGPVKFLTFQTGYERLCGKCNKANSQLRAAAVRKSRRHAAWNKGLTEETSDAVKRAAQGCRDFIAEHGHWRKGAYVEGSLDKAREALAKKWRDGTHPMIGRNASNDERIAARGRAISKALKGSDKHWTKKPTANEINKKIIDTRRAKIESGENSPFRFTPEQIKEKIKLIDKNWIVPEFEFNGHQTMIDVTCQTCNNVLSSSFVALYKGRVCPTCNPPNYSKWHREIVEFIESLGVTPDVNTRKVIAPFEVDVFIPERDIAIECNGLYWHSEMYHDNKTYHQNKSDRCNAKGISLFHLFEDEWREKQDIVKSMLRVKLGKAKKIHARQTTIVENHSDVKEFLNDNHLDGSTKQRHSFSLVYEGEIVMTLTVRKPHQVKRWKDDTIEIARIASLRDHVVIGGASKLISAAKQWAREQGFKRLMSYRDTRLGGLGHAYDVSGFVVSHTTQPRFWWTDGTHRYDRFLVKAIPGIATQEEMAMEHRVSKIWGCANVVYVCEL